MDDLISRFDAEVNGDLTIASRRGIAWQTDRHYRAPVDYWQKCSEYGGGEIETRLNALRVGMVDSRIGPGTPLLDIGIGSGAFIRSRPMTWGFDVTTEAIAWLQANELLSRRFDHFAAFSMWDVIEHCDDPQEYFQRMKEGSFMACSLPIFDDLRKIRASKHYRPGEHLYYFTEDGFVDWMGEHGWRVIDRNDAETGAGREAIMSFAFIKDRPGYHATIEQYRKLYEPNYGASSRDLYLDLIAPIVRKLNPISILDYGCGRSDLLAHFWADGRRRLAWYDPAIAERKTLPGGPFGLALCCDVLEHVRMEDIGRVLGEIRERTRHVIFVISLKAARAILPDGRNAHITLLTASEWRRWIAEAFGEAKPVKMPWPHVLMLTTW